MFCLRRNQVCPSRNWKRFQREINKDAGLFPKISFFRCFPHIFAVAKQLPCFSISRLVSVKDFFNVYIFLKCKYMCNGGVTLEIYSTFYHNNYGNYNFIADTQCDPYIFHVNESLQICMISGETLPVKTDFNHAWRHD